MRRATAARRAGPPRPPEGTPAPDELAAQARAVLADAVRLARWTATVGGRAAPPRPAPGGTLPDPELQRAAAALELTPRQVQVGWDRARLAGLVELRDGAAHPGWRLSAWDRDDTAVLRGWVALFDAWSLCHPAPCGSDHALVAEVVEAAPQLLSLLHLSSGPVAVPVLLDLLRQRVAELRTERHEPPADGGADPLPGLLDWTLDALVEVGALRPRAGDGEVALTPLGNWAVWVKLEQICVAAQGPAGHIEQSAEDLLRACSHYSPGPARVEYRAWLAARPVGQAVAELLQVARGDDALLRGLAFEALRTVGAPAEPAVSAVVDEPRLRPYALLWLAEQQGCPPEEQMALLTREEATWLWVDTAAAVADHGEGHLLLAHLDTAVQGSVPRLLDEIRETGHPRIVQVLVALAAALPDPALAKIVRRAAFEVHTGGE
ncbi:hypothetical protein SCATT_10330 [Streptantibioticus cattleyicolor NRRL 8057 = DSM 46488]|uniref:Uncharacterized protein n=1 Tax=Streptantibioticus cattleyicolor (strain ATCC 35852 / DSM 46488 / JCM 4925 / NBRC 14057 / NRRL 8057) TaxID=1003195 RepID=F8JY20_STREN|nr:hypothetical protein SCATT_10330 [Streptantibioticus cattleyicolor NRRL 8057 = DSM 46488]MYS58118.1 hypothetical protein [Streptomyces sp. SID5468]CCB73760.1 conserved protein of unknown function [Streptantibioticus cattleyicolor NRRL 8057 = DSM 46488]